jgi:hypothetical protein
LLVSVEDTAQHASRTQHLADLHFRQHERDSTILGTPTGKERCTALE